ncbi:MAG: DUF4013 domain-containing protein [Isosphaeraceae bacterium]
MNDVQFSCMAADLEPDALREPASLPPPRPGRLANVVRALRWIGGGIASASDWLFGAFALTIGLSVLSSVPVAQFLAFGYLLEAGGRVARSGRFRDGLIGIRKASRVGSMVIGVWLFYLPLQLVSSLAISAELVDPGGASARAVRGLLIVLTVLIDIHVIAACARGGRVRHFLIPFGNPFWMIRRLRRGGAYGAGRDAVWDFLSSLRLPYYFRLGLLGFLGTMAWLLIPVSILAAGQWAPILALPGTLLLGLVVVSLPFLQARFAVENRFGALFSLREIRQRFQRAPWAFAFALAVTLTSAVPLYLLKIEMIPRETVWLPSLVFLVFIYPARLLTGWAYGRSLRREPPRHGFFRWTGRLAIFPMTLAYVLIVYISQYTAWRGVWNLYEQHAFLLPVPFLGI